MRPRKAGFDITVGDTDIKLGQRVVHGKFGEGVVVNYEGEGKQARIQVNFNSEGSKWLMLAYANLQPA
jgi:DNA helicase-2/ATP-dependent DNA helicase PcrA